MAHKMVAGEKKRNISLIVYVPDESIEWTDEGYRIIDQKIVDEQYERLCQKCDDLRVKCCISPLHYADRYDDKGIARWLKNHVGEDGKLSDEDKARMPDTKKVKKPHWHVFLAFGGSRYLGGLKKMWADWGISVFWVEDDRQVAIRYQCHLDSPNKATYDVNQVMAFGGLDISCLWDASKIDKLGVIESICHYIKENECTNYYDLTMAMLSFEDPELFDCLLTRTPFFCNFMAGLAQKLAKQEEQARKLKE